MPTFVASCGVLNVTFSPCHRTSPSVAAWIPAMTFTNVDLPAPLSPTSPMTSPAWTSKSTPLRACTAPKRFVMPRNSSSGAESVMVMAGLLLLLDACCVAGRLVLAGADLRRLPEAVLDDRVVDLVLRHGDGGQQDRRDLATAVVARAGDDAGRRLLALQQGVGELGGHLGLGLDGLVDRHVLVTGDDALHAGQLRVLTRGGDGLRVDAVGLHRRDRATGVAVVGGVDADEPVLAERRDRLLHLLL